MITFLCNRGDLTRGAWAIYVVWVNGRLKTSEASHIATLPTCSNGTLTKSVATRECHAADTGHDTPTRHSIQTQGRRVVVLSIVVERHTGKHNYPF